MSGIGSSIDSIFDCASLRPDIRFDIDRFGVGRFSFSSICAPSDVLELFLTSFGEDVGRWSRFIALEALLIVLAGFGECCINGDVAGWEGRRTLDVLILGVAGVVGVLNPLVEGRFDASFATV